MTHILEQAIARNSRYGWFAVAGTTRGVRNLTFGHATRALAFEALLANTDDTEEIEFSEIEAAVSLGQNAMLAAIKSAATQIELYLNGVPVDLGIIPLDLPETTTFRQAVRDALRTVPYGETVTYGELAERAGSPRAARAVGTAMSTNPVPLLIPCHRVLGSGNQLGGYSAPQGVAMKRRLLEMESTLAPSTAAADAKRHRHPAGGSVAGGGTSRGEPSRPSSSRRR